MSGLWATVRMEPTTRKLVFHKSTQFTIKQIVEAFLALPDARHDDTVSGLTGPIQIQVA